MRVFVMIPYPAMIIAQLRFSVTLFHAVKYRASSFVCINLLEQERTKIPPPSSFLPPIMAC